MLVYKSYPGGWTQVRRETEHERKVRHLRERSVKGVSTWTTPGNMRNPITRHIRGRVYKRGATTWVSEVWIGDHLVMSDNTGYWDSMLQDAYEGVWMVSRLYVYGYDPRALQPKGTRAEKIQALWETMEAALGDASMEAEGLGETTEEYLVPDHVLSILAEAVVEGWMGS